MKNQTIILPLLIAAFVSNNMQAYGKRQPKAKVSSDSTAVADNDMSVMLKNITVTASRGVARKTPIAMSDVDRREVENKLGNNELPEMLNQTPGVYATKNSGAYGDSKLNMRGFQSSNVAVMVNGVPVNDMEHGGLYWSNWADWARWCATCRRSADWVPARCRCRRLAAR